MVSQARFEPPFADDSIITVCSNEPSHHGWINLHSRLTFSSSFGTKNGITAHESPFPIDHRFIWLYFYLIFVSVSLSYLCCSWISINRLCLSLSLSLSHTHTHALFFRPYIWTFILSTSLIYCFLFSTILILFIFQFPSTLSFIL